MNASRHPINGCEPFAHLLQQNALARSLVGSTAISRGGNPSNDGTERDGTAVACRCVSSHFCAPFHKMECRQCSLCGDPISGGRDAFAKPTRFYINTTTGGRSGRTRDAEQTHTHTNTQSGWHRRRRTNVYIRTSCSDLIKNRNRNAQCCAPSRYNTLPGFRADDTSHASE